MIHISSNHSTEHPMNIRIRHRVFRALSLCCAAILSAGLTGALPGAVSSASAALNAPEGSLKLDVFPSEVSLKSKRSSQSIVVRVTEASGIQRDVTAKAEFAFSDAAKAKIEKGILTPLADGATTLKVTFSGQSVEVPVKVEQAQVDPALSFRNDIMPVFLKGGCNSGGCHGSARGQDGFRLSLFGYDPEGDHFRLTREMAGRRVNLAIPDESLLLTKIDGAAPHTGGKVFEKDSELRENPGPLAGIGRPQ